MRFDKLTFKVLLGLSAASIAGCSGAEDLCATGARLTVDSETLRDELIANLEGSDIDYRLAENGEICYSSRAAGTVMTTVIELDSAQRPDAQFRILGGAFSENVFQGLEDAGIEFSYSDDESSDEVLLQIRNAEDVGRAREIVHDTAEQMYNTP